MQVVFSVIPIQGSGMAMIKFKGSVSGVLTSHVSKSMDDDEQVSFICFETLCS